MNAVLATGDLNAINAVWERVTSSVFCTWVVSRARVRGRVCISNRFGPRLPLERLALLEWEPWGTSWSTVLGLSKLGHAPPIRECPPRGGVDEKYLIFLVKGRETLSSFLPRTRFWCYSPLLRKGLSAAAGNVADGARLFQICVQEFRTLGRLLLGGALWNVEWVGGCWRPRRGFRIHRIHGGLRIHRIHYRIH